MKLTCDIVNKFTVQNIHKSLGIYNFMVRY